ncbi:MAG TPA: helix-turn-helix domain-containing protein [Symbiobacteriaceae bacterium]|jgi:DNA-binding transcriptional ArsR family regulator|nr:helix-turn-helix domain-containing protein [Symbiobacteriaceae bacterium]
MGYRVSVDFAPAHELVLSLDAFFYTPAKSLDLGAEWVSETRKRFGAAKDWESPYDPFLLTLLVQRCPGNRTAEAFLEWLAGLTPGQLYELVTPYVPDKAADLLRGLGGRQAYYLSLLTAWNEAYFRALDPAVLRQLEAEAAWRSKRVKSQSPADALEEATTGMVMESDLVDEVLLVPQYHYRPLIRLAKCGATVVCGYPMEAPCATGVPAPQLLRVTRALGDDSRLRILHYLAGGPARTFTDVLKFSGLSKNTVHYHLLALRSAGLVRVHLTGECAVDRYSARRATVEGLSARLVEYLNDQPRP